MVQVVRIHQQIVNNMKKNYLSELHVSRDINDNIYLFISVNEKQMLKDKADMFNLFSENELDDIFKKTTTTKILLQDSSLRTYPLENLANVQTIKIINDQSFTTYLITLNNNQIEFPAKIIFNYSFKFRYYRFLDEKLKNPNFRNEIDLEKNISFLYKQIADYDESLVNYDHSELVRHTETIMTPDIDFRIYNNIKERVHFASSAIDTRAILNSIITSQDGFNSFDKIIIANNSLPIIIEEQKNIFEYYQKLINTRNDYDYKRYLNDFSIFKNIGRNKKKTVVLPELQKTNLSNLSTFSDETNFPKENINLKTDDSKDSVNLFLLFILLDGIIQNPTTDEEKQDYLDFLSDSFKYPKYFFKHVLKFKIEYLSSLDHNSMNEQWSDLNQDVIDSDQILFCRVNLKNKKYYDRVAYEYFLLGA